MPPSFGILRAALTCNYRGAPVSSAWLFPTALMTSQLPHPHATAFRQAAILAAFLASTALSQTAAADPIRVEGGLIEGQQEATVTVFKGIPFAMPPVGDLRWRAPQPPLPWAGIRKADTFAPICPQDGASVPGAPTEPTSEDCLYLNVWTPAHAAGAKLPVMVWIYGGGFSQGSASMPLYWGDKLALRGVLLVTISYRVGPFGFMAHPELSRESPDHVSGNYGLLDQIAALQWVQRNIAAFGGDPHCVTIFGQSAGSSSVCLLVACPSAKGLFQRAIAESGGCFAPLPAVPGFQVILLKGAEKKGLDLQKKLGAASLADMRRLPAAEILKAGQNMPWMFLFDRHVIDRQPYDVLSSGDQADVPLLLGTNGDEGRPFLDGTTVTASNFRSGLSRTMLANIPASVLDHYPANSDEEAFASRAALERDVRFGWDAWTWAKFQSTTGTAPVYYYHFAHLPPAPAGSAWARWGAGHWAELPYVFGHPAQAPGPWALEDRSLSDTMMGYWTNFAKLGDPNGPGLPVWPAFTSAKPQVLHFDSTVHVGGVANLEKLEALDRYFAEARKQLVDGL